MRKIKRWEVNMKDLLVFLADGFEEIEALTPVDYLRRAELEVTTVSITDSREVKGAHGIVVLADTTIGEVNPEEYRGIFCPGGLPGATNLAGDSKVIDLVKKFNAEGKMVAAICAGPHVFDTAEILNEGKFTCYPGYEGNLKTGGRVDELVVVDKNVVTSMGPSTAQVLAFKLIEILKDEKSKKDVEEEVLFPILLRELCR